MNTGKAQRQYEALNDNNLFDGLLVDIAVSTNIDSIQAANQIFLNGVDLFRNEKNPDGAITKFKESIFKCPSAKAYYELGNAYLEVNNDEKALLAFTMAEQLGYEPFAKLLYNLSCVHSRLSNIELSGRYLEYAIQAGYANFDHIEKDEDLEKLRKSHLFRHHFQRAVDGVANKENIFWVQFRQKFATAKFPIVLEHKIHSSFFEDEKFISYDYERFVPSMRNERFSRDVGNAFYYFVKVQETELFTALIYIEKDAFLEDYAPIVYKMITYTPEGKIIDQKMIGGRTSVYDPLMVSKINKDGRIEITYYDVIHEKNVEREGFYENPIKEMKETRTETLQIQSNGKISLVQS
jgi:tetratricopeptide (TPR) repeat protein